MTKISLNNYYLERTICVTGCFGFIGSTLVKKLLMLKNLIQFLDKKIKIRVFFLNKPIKLSRTGKRQAVINRMNIDFQKITKNKLKND